MQDEYKSLDSSGQTFTFQGDFLLECGQTLRTPSVRFNTWGNLAATRDNVVVVCHALTGNSQLDSWWGGLLGEGPTFGFDTSKYLIVCANILGSCYGTTGPRSINPLTNQPYGSSFPATTVRDTVRLHKAMVEHTFGKGVVIHAVIGGSFGGMQALEWALICGTSVVRRIIVIGCGATHSAWQIAISEVQRQAIYSDDKWRNGDFPLHDQPTKGLSLARQIAMITYRSRTAFENKFSRGLSAPPQQQTHTPTQNTDQLRNELCVRPDWSASAYLLYQGTKFLSRFDALTYVRLTEQMDTHDVGRARGGVKNALATLTQPVLVLGMSSDVLYPLEEQQILHDALPNSRLVVVDTVDGHDGFLLEQDFVNKQIINFLRTPSPKVACVAKY